MVLWDTGPPFLQSADFPNNVLFLAATIRLLINWPILCEQCELELSNNHCACISEVSLTT